MKIDRVKIYDLEESIIASGYPMSVDTDDSNYEVKNLDYWINSGILKYFIPQKKELIPLNTKDSCKICGSSFKILKFKCDEGFYCNKHYKMMVRYGEIRHTNRNKRNDIILNKQNAEIITTDVENNETGRYIIDFEDIVKVLSKRWYNSNGYCTNTNGESLHRLLSNATENDIVDHKDRNTYNNLQSNLRKTCSQNNSFNSSIKKNNTSGIIGVSYVKERKKWKAHLVINNKQKHLGYFENKREATIARLCGEKEYFNIFSPQRHLFEEYGLKPLYEEKEMGKEFSPNLYKATCHYKRMIKLGNTQRGLAHDNAINGILIAFDLTFTNKAWVELQRYHFIDFVSSQSTMHRISSFDLTNQYNEYVDSRIINIMNELKDKYNLTKDPEDYLKLLYSNPSGFELTARLTTNYGQLKTMYIQRHTHRLPEWREFCEWILTLPHFTHLTGIGCSKSKENAIKLKYEFIKKME